MTNQIYIDWKCFFCDYIMLWGFRNGEIMDYANLVTWYF